MRIPIAVTILLLPLALLAQPGAWTNIGPRPAAVTTIVADPRGSGTIYVTTYAAGILKSADSGATWSAVNNGVTDLTVGALAIDASGPQTVYAGGFKTDDGGATWRNLPAISGSVTALAADPNRPGVIYASAVMNLASGSVRKSVDGGATWTTIFPTTAAVFRIAIDPMNSDILYLATIGHGAFKSTNGGQAWSPISSLTSAAVWTIAIDSRDSQVLYAGTNEDGVWKSSDAGMTWRPTGSLSQYPVYSIAIDPSPAHTIYAGTNGGGIWTSSDDGDTWNSTGPPNNLIRSLAVDPAAGTVFAGTNWAGVLASSDLGATWSVLDTGIDRASKPGYGLWIDPHNSQNILLGFEGALGLVGTQDGGASWSVAGQGFTGLGSRGVDFDPTDSRRVYAGAIVGSLLFKSSDSGRTWSRRFFGSPAVYVIAVVVDPVSPNIVYAGTGNEGVFKSTDYGDTWAAAGTGLSGSITYLTPDPTKSGRLFASTGQAFFLSADGGQSWSNVMAMPAWTVTIDPNMPSTVYATTRTQGVLRSSDGGHTWQPINNGITNLTMRRSAPVIIDPTNPLTLYVASEGGGAVFKSLDGGSYWFAVNSGLDELRVTGLTMDPRNPSVLYACGPAGVYKTRTGGEE
jgi:photosystem II stability/assembly factor-like uncharacterized protein